MYTSTWSSVGKTFALKIIGMRMLISSLNNECKKSCCILLQLPMNPWPWRVLIGSLLKTFLFCQNLPQKSTIGEKWYVLTENLKIRFKKNPECNLFEKIKERFSSSCDTVVKHLEKTTQGRGYARQADGAGGENGFRNEFIKQRDHRISCFLVLRLNVV